MAKVRKYKGSRYFYAVWRDSTGKRHERSTKQTDKRAAERTAGRLELEGTVPSVPAFQLKDALTLLYQHKVRKKVSDAEIQIVRAKGKRLLEHFGGSKDCNTFVAHDFDLYVDARRAGGEGVRPAGDATIKKELGKLFEAMRLGVRLSRYIGPDPKALMPTVLAADVPRDRWLDTHEYAALLREVDREGRGGRPTDWLKSDYVITYVNVGVRYSELYKIEAKHFDRDGRRIYIAGTKTLLSKRWVPLSEAAFAVIERRANLYPQGALFPRRWPKPNMHVSLRRACKRAGIEPVSTNDLRRTFVSWCCRYGVSEMEVQKFVGHSPASKLVRRVYGQLAPEAGRAAVARFPGVPEPVPAAELTDSERALLALIAQRSPIDQRELLAFDGIDIKRAMRLRCLGQLEAAGLVTHEESEAFHPERGRNYSRRTWSITATGALRS